MIQFTTTNSVYQVRIVDDAFHVKKVGVVNPESTHFSVGDEVVSGYLELGIGMSAAFAGVRTSRVLAITESA